MEKGIGPKLSAKYGLRAYSTIYFINGNGKKIHESVGYKGVSDFINLGKQALKKYKPTKNNNKKTVISSDGYLNVASKSIKNNLCIRV